MLVPRMAMYFTGEGTEYRLSEKLPKVGDVLKRNGDDWVVVVIDEQQYGASVVKLRPGLKPA